MELAGKPLTKVKSNLHFEGGFYHVMLLCSPGQEPTCLPRGRLKEWGFLALIRRNQMLKCWGCLEKGPPSSSSLLQLTRPPEPQTSGCKALQLTPGVLKSS